MHREFYQNLTCKIIALKQGQLISLSLLCHNHGSPKKVKSGCIKRILCHKASPTHSEWKVVPIALFILNLLNLKLWDHSATVTMFENHQKCPAHLSHFSYQLTKNPIRNQYGKRGFVIDFIRSCIPVCLQTNYHV